MINKLTSDIHSGDKIGCMTIYYNDNILTNIDIILANDLIRNDWKYYFVEILNQLKKIF